ncbi:hypothetical protein [Shewanella kaireitica]|uniref:hypothetical protein n=1 Tax=Shewanella kaireitica TaxID=212021 RepID=UPI00200C00EA|nr:hypothetical protein [Shewanella kaireitica]MCL1094712.1 hypothetical protein [Shewanella kaireitica]
MSIFTSKSILLSASLLLVSLQLSLVSSVQAAGSFYATQALQSQLPQAFALQPEAHDFLKAAQTKTIKDGDKLVELILADKDLTTALSKWHTLSIDEQIPFLRKVFALEYRSMGIKPPKLIIDNHSYPNKMVYFDFDLTYLYPLATNDSVNSGVVYLNPDKLAAQDKFASLAFLIHETRHSYQFQLSQQQHSNVKDNQLASGYMAAFSAQKSLTGFGFSDFLTLLNEYEAFQYGNYVLGRLTQWQFDLISMGTFASQFNSAGKLKIDLLQLANHNHRAETTTETLSLLEKYNQAAKQQYQLRQIAKAP